MNKKHTKVYPAADPLIEEVRTIRKAISDEFNNDVSKLCQHLREIERQQADRIVQPSRPYIQESAR